MEEIGAGKKLVFPSSHTAPDKNRNDRMMIAKIADWLLVFATSLSLLLNIGTIYAKKADYIVMKQLNPGFIASPFFSTIVLSPVVPIIIIGFIIAAIVVNVAKQFYISSMKHRIITNLFVYAISVFIAAKLFLMLSH
jgi:hypothetical protein